MEESCVSGKLGEVWFNPETYQTFAKKTSLVKCVVSLDWRGLHGKSGLDVPHK